MKKRTYKFKLEAYAVVGTYLVYRKKPADFVYSALADLYNASDNAMELLCSSYLLVLEKMGRGAADLFTMTASEAIKLTILKRKRLTRL